MLPIHVKRGAGCFVFCTEMLLKQMRTSGTEERYELNQTEVLVVEDDAAIVRALSLVFDG